MALALKQIEEGIRPFERTEKIGIQDVPCSPNYYAGVYGDKHNITIVIIEREPKPKFNFLDVKINEPDPTEDDLREGYFTRIWDMLTLKIDDHQANFSAIKKSINDFFKKWKPSGIKVNNDFEPVADFIKRRFKETKIDADAGYFVLNCLMNEGSIYFNESLIKDFQEDKYLRSKKEDQDTKKTPTDRINALYAAFANYDYTQSSGLSGGGLGKNKPHGVAP